jgi:hypothetical protein
MISKNVVCTGQTTAKVQRPNCPKDHKKACNILNTTQAITKISKDRLKLSTIEEVIVAQSSGSLVALALRKFCM